MSTRVDALRQELIRRALVADTGYIAPYIKACDAIAWLFGFRFSKISREGDITLVSLEGDERAITEAEFAKLADRLDDLKEFAR
jgi:hypothetical protein